MGNKTSKNPMQEWLDPCEVYKSTEDVEAKLVDVFYRFREELVQRLRDLFDKRSWVDPDNSKNYWRAEDLIKYLVEQNESLGDAIREAGPLLFEIAVHHGSYPFPPTDGARLTCNQFLIFIGMCTSIQDETFIKRIWRPSGSLAIRDKPRDFQRLFFQSISSNKTPRDPNVRSEADDEDLIDVLQSAAPSDYRHGWNEDKLSPVLSSLPSSRSTDLSGIITEQELRLLLRLFVCVALKKNEVECPKGSSWLQFTQDLVRSLLHLFSSTSANQASISGESFLTIVTDEIPYLLENLRDLIQDSFQIGENKNPKIPMPWPTQASKIIDPKLATLMQFMVGSWVGGFKSLLLFGEPDRGISKEFMNELKSTAPRLLLMKGHEEHADSEKQTVTVAIALRLAQDKNTYEVIRPGEGFLQIELLKLTPTCTKLADGHATIRSTATSESSDAGLNIRFDDATVALTERFEFINSKKPKRNLKFLVESFELRGYTSL